MRYYSLTNRWVSQLNLADCIALIEQIEKGKKYRSMLEKFYNRYGELDPQGAIARLNESLWKSADTYSTLLSNVLQGWGRKHPAEAWDFFSKLDQNEVLKDHFYRDLAFEVFQAWAARDVETAYNYLLKAEGQYFYRGASGYYFGLPQRVDFHREAAQLEITLKEGRHLCGSSLVINGQEWYNQQELAVRFAGKWAMKDADAATEWLLRVFPGAGQQKNNPEWIANRLGFFVASWSGLYGPNEPDAAIEWTLNQHELLQSTIFQELAIPFIAKNSPVEIFDIVQKIQSVDRQALLLEQLVRSPAHQIHGYYGGVMGIAACVEPDVMESALHQFAFTEQQRQRVSNAIQERRDYEAKQPPPPPSDW